SLTHLYNNSGRYADAVEMAERAIEFIKQEGDGPLGLALSYHGRSLNLLNRQEEALPQLEAALPLVERAGDALTLYDVLRNLNVVYDLRGEFNSAKAYAERAFTLAEQLGNPNLVALALNNRACVAFERGEWQLVREEYEQSITLMRQADLPWGATYPLF